MLNKDAVDAATPKPDTLPMNLTPIYHRSGLPVVHAFARADSAMPPDVPRCRRLAEGPLDGCFHTDDALALGAISARRDTGLRVPQDVGAIGVNDIEIAGREVVNLITIALPATEIVCACIARTGSLIADPATPPEAQVFEAALNLRDTLQSRA